MSEATTLTPQQPTRKTRPRLDEATRRAIIARVVETDSISGTAKEFGLHTNTVSRLWASVKKVRNTGHEGWREKLANELPSQAVDAIELSVKDRIDIHKAAATGMGLLKGLGHLQGEGVSVNIQQVIGSIPEEWRSEMITTPQVSNSIPTTGCGPEESAGYEGKAPDQAEGKRNG
jgi:transposase-like protein